MKVTFLLESIQIKQCGSEGYQSFVLRDKIKKKLVQLSKKRVVLALIVIEDKKRH